MKKLTLSDATITIPGTWATKIEIRFPDLSNTTHGQVLEFLNEQMKQIL